MLSIRKFQPSDFQRVLAIEQEAFHEHNPLAYMRLYEMNPDRFLVAEKDGEVIGFAVGMPLTDEIARLLSVAVAKKYRRSGVATQLINEIADIFINKGFKSLQLEVQRSNISAQHLYKTLKFGIIGTIQNYYANGEDAIVMRRILNGADTPDRRTRRME
jgi:ribosomal-protein-alanine N-acetyltransferase